MEEMNYYIIIEKNIINEDEIILGIATDLDEAFALINKLKNKNEKIIYEYIFDNIGKEIKQIKIFN
jgi:hypothetical protein